MFTIIVLSCLTVNNIITAINNQEIKEVHCANIEIIRAMHDTCTDPALDQVLSLEDEYQLCD